MKLTAEDSEKVNKYINEIWPESRRVCAVCGKDEWKYLDYLFALTECDFESHPCKGYPVIALICVHCGNLMLFSAKCMGIVNGRE